jgi:hypothetical protein
MVIYCPLIVLSDGAMDKPRNNYFVCLLGGVKFQFKRGAPQSHTSKVAS